MELPQLPVSIDRFIQYASKCDSRTELNDSSVPFKAYESKLREIYAQQPEHPATRQNHLVPIFAPGSPLPIVKSRDVKSEGSEEKDCYLLPIDEEARREDGSAATVKNLSEFRTNFNLFCESSLVDMDWSNVIAAGSSVVTALLPVNAPHNESKRALRAYYHQTLAPASDVDLFIYGLDEKQAIEKIKQIETKVRDNVLSETTTIRTKNAITIVSEYPTRHVQIVLRLYKSVSEILTGFDVDCSCVAYDGQQVWASPRALTAFMTQVNTIDLTRRSPSYENRLSKYSHRGFEVLWLALDRSRVDPTIFERSFSRVVGLARILLLEKLPHPNDRSTYLAKRREERGRPPLPWNSPSRYRHQLPGNIKDVQPDDVAEWVEEDDISNYHTFTIPYGPRYNAKKIEKLLFTKDLLLNAEWNRSKDRQTRLHRHPAFFGAVQDVITDCCGFCPKPETDEDLAAFEEESKLYISGDVDFLKDDPGRQAVGSFHPITDNDWTEMAYVGNTTRLCQAIVDKDLESVEDWFSSGDPDEILDVNRRDHAGRTPLLLAAMAGTPEIVQFLVDHGARLVSRLYNGMTALHIAAYRGEVDMVRMILDRSAANAEEEECKEDARKAVRRAALAQSNEPTQDSETDGSSQHDGEEDSNTFNSDDESSDEMTEGSFVRVSDKGNDHMPEDVTDEPDFYDIDVLAWDVPMSPLHLAVIAGKVEVVKLLIDKYGADVLLPVKILEQRSNGEPEAAILSLILALEAPLSISRNTIDTLLSHGAVVMQADMKERSALHFAINEAKMVIVEAMQSGTDSNTLRKAVNHVSVSSRNWYQQEAEAPLLTAIRTRNFEIIDNVLSMGADAEIDYESYAKAYVRVEKYALRQSPEDIKKAFRKSVEQPIVLSTKLEMPEVALRLIEAGADVNTLPRGAWQWLEGQQWGNSENASLLDIVRNRIRSLEDSIADKKIVKPEMPEALAADDTYLEKYPKDSYQYWTAAHDLFQAKIVKKVQRDEYESEMKQLSEPGEPGMEKKRLLTQEMIASLKILENEILHKGGKTFYELHPNAMKTQENQYNHDNTGDTTLNDSPYTTCFSFNDVSMTEEKNRAYLELFEAAWTGDIEAVKELCLASKDPLQVGTRDLANFSPFTLAVIRGHQQLANVILDIATLQYEPPENTPKYRYRLGTAEVNQDDYGSDDNDTDDVDEPQILRELLNEKFTIDDIAAVADNVKSKVSPLAVLNGRAGIWRANEGRPDQAMESCGLMTEKPIYNIYFFGQKVTKMSWPWFHKALPEERLRCNQSLVYHAIVNNNMEMLRFLLKAGQNLMLRKDDDDNSNVYTIRDDDFTSAIKLGRTEMISEIIKSTGHGIPLNKLVETSGVELEEKPKYYQGLSVYGKKRKDWADRGQGRHAAVEPSDEAPLLKVLFRGNLQTSEYYFSDGPLNRYQEFAKAHQDDARIQSLAKTGIDRALSKWLGTRADLAIHMAVMASPVDKDNSLLEYVLKAMPGAIDTKSSGGLTPLQLAFRLGRVDAVKMLLAAGANQATRNDDGDNILHTLVQVPSLIDPQILASVFGLLDDKLLQPLLLEKTSKPDPGSMTPLAVYMSQHTGDSHVMLVLRIILGHSKGKDLEVMNGAGDYLLHTMVRRGDVKLVKCLVEYRPEMLYWENATGLTPMDIAQIAWLRNVTENPPQIRTTERFSIVDQQPSAFVESELSEDQKEIDRIMDLDKEIEKERSSQWYMHRFMQQLAEQYPGKRKLVSVFDANEVVKRLAKQQQKRNEENRRQERMGLNSTGMKYREMFDDYDKNRRRSRRSMKRRYIDADGTWVYPEEGEDEVERWMNTANNFPKADLIRLEKEVKEGDKESEE